jgi:hypothetical protein
MGWLGKLTGKGGAAVAEREADPVAAPDVPSGPPLIILVNDASGRASFKTNVFNDIEAATDWVRYWFPQHVEEGMTAFWALTEPPQNGPESWSEVEAEALVLIRDEARNGVVYLFSFLDIESALDYLRQQVAHGTKLGQLMLYWAVPVKRQADESGQVILTPSTPTATGARGAGAAASEPPQVPTDGWAVPAREIKTVITQKEPARDPRAHVEAPNAYSGVSESELERGNDTFTLTSWAERASKRRKPDESSSSAKRAVSSFEPPAARTPERAAGIVSTAEVVDPATDPMVADEEPNVEIGAGEIEEATAAIDEAAAPAPPVTEAVEAVAGAEAVEAAGEAEASVPNGMAEVVDDERGDEIQAGATVGAGTATEEPDPSAPPEPAVEEAAEGLPSERAEVAEVGRETIVAEPPQPDAAAPVVDQVVEDASRDPSAVTQEAAGNDGHTPDSPTGEEYPEVVPHVNGNGNGHSALGQGELKIHTNGYKEEVTGLNGEGSASAYAGVNGHTTGQGNGRAPEPARKPVAGESEGNGVNDGSLDSETELRIVVELRSKALKIRRWEVRDEPFEGFKSPPGKF